MSTVTGTNPFSNVGLQTTNDLNKQEQVDNELDQSDFMRLLTTQLQHQDPSKPLENTDFIAQMAQFGVNEGVAKLNDNFGELSNSLVSNQALQASALVGRGVMVDARQAVMIPGQALSGESNLPRSYQNVVMNISDSTGNVVYSQEYGPQAAGDFEFEWDGKNNSGFELPQGVYEVSLEGRSGDESLSLNTKLVAHVESVTVGQGAQGLMLNLSGGGQVPFNSVSRIQ
ncbi:MAG: hypothetical protein CMF25_04715 [Kangiellaceae bacterium]|nr:hypothetical protein [Kangiellaceae bacterium]|tara:strand:+ start:1108 stop:1791 length:684 start_codon:yes stop_codon:yes gene_type:complete